MYTKTVRDYLVSASWKNGFSRLKISHQIKHQIWGYVPDLRMMIQSTMVTIVCRNTRFGQNFECGFGAVRPARPAVKPVLLAV